ncbi:MAG: hypothetical protein Fur0019_18930 [Tibeticola sp.]
MQTTADPSPRPPIRALSEVSRYALISALALLLDIGVMAALARFFDWPLVAASAVGFTCGMVMAYRLAGRWAFRGHAHREGWRGLLVFSVIGGGGLAVNSALVWIGVAAAGLAWPVAKLGAATGSFIFNYALRKRMLYAVQGEARR